MSQPQSKYKLSRYNVFRQNGYVQYMWNTYSNALVKLDIPAQAYLRKFESVPREDDGTKEFALLRDNGFIVHENIDEFGRVVAEEKQALFSVSSELNFVIAPGMGCNYDCTYCYQNACDHSKIMSQEVAVDTAIYICGLIDAQTPKQVTVTWFGGEPLLYLPAIELISKKIIEYTKARKVDYSANIITNGRFMDSETVDLFQELQIKSAQITLDGTRDVYCESKGASPYDFDTVVGNLVYASDKLNVTVRLNIPNDEVSEATRITDYLFEDKALREKIDIYLAHLRDYTVTDKEAQNEYIRYVESQNKYILFLNKRYPGTQIGRSIKSGFSRRRSTFCGNICSNSFYIGASGEMYRCGLTFGNETRITGDIWRGKYFNEPEFAHTVSIDSSQKEKCAKCEYVPICMGNCQNYRVTGYCGFDCRAYQRQQWRFKLMEGGESNGIID